MRRLSSFGAFLGGATLFIMVQSGPAGAAVIRTNQFESGADSALGNDSVFSPTTQNGSTGTGMEIRANDTATNRNRLGIIRFDLSGIEGDPSGATLQVFETGNNSRSVTVYGLVDGDTGENWDEATISYSTAPAISAGTNPTSPTTPLTNFDPTRTVVLGTFGTTSSTAELLSFSSAALDSFLAADTNDLVTLYLYRDGGGSVTVRTKENTANTPPTLNLPNAVVPEPAAASLLGLVALGALAARPRGR